MSYTSLITERNPGYIIFLLDQSKSMEEPIANQGTLRKADALAAAANSVLQNLIIASKKKDRLRSCFYITALGYRGDGEVVNALSGNIGKLNAVTIVELNAAPHKHTKKVFDLPAVGGETQRFEREFPLWIEPIAAGGTPMIKALRQATLLCKAWVSDSSTGFPPIVFNMTDGEWTDEGDGELEAQHLQRVATDDGNALLFNIHLSSKPSPPISFPDTEPQIEDEFAGRLFRMSSVLPTTMRKNAQKFYPELRPGSRAFAFNADFSSLVKFLDVGTRTFTADMQGAGAR